MTVISPPPHTHSVSGLPAVFDLTSGGDVLDAMSPRELRILVGAANFHALTAPGRELMLHLYDGHDELTPRTTDDRTFDGKSRVFRRRTASVGIRSRVDLSSHTESGDAQELLSHASRHLYISPDAVLEMPPRRWQPTDPVRRALRALRTRSPLLYDQARDIELARFRHVLNTPVRRRDYAAEFMPGGVHDDLVLDPLLRTPEGRPGAVLIGMHWFEMGGAERWALESVRIVREAGLLPVVISNVDSQHPFICRPELDGAVVIPFSEPTHFSQTPGSEAFLRGVLSTFDLRGVIVHHNQWLYDRLPWIKASRPDTPVIDSTHIVEYRGGGYPMSSARAARYIDTHHVISPSLADWLVDTQKVSREKVVMAPLGGLTVDLGEAEFKPRVIDTPLRVAFVGRMSRQKSPEIFIAMAARLLRRSARVEFIMHGDGELDDWVDDLIKGLGKDAPVVRRTSAVPVAATLDAADVLVVTSHNEGLTLTTLEAIAHGVPVISTDVGAQSDVLPPEALFTNHPYRGARTAADLIAKLSTSESARRDLWKAEKKLERKLLKHVSATEWLTEVVSEW